MALLMSLKRLGFNTPDDERSWWVYRSYKPMLKPAEPHMLCTSTKRCFYYMAMRVMHENNLRESPLHLTYFDTFFIIYMTHLANLVLFYCIVLAYWHFQFHI